MKRVRSSLYKQVATQFARHDFDDIRSNGEMYAWVGCSVLGSISCGYKFGQGGSVHDRKGRVAFGCSVGGIVTAVAIHFWPISIPAYAIYKVAEVASRD
jgi:hypothetical protein